MKTISFFISAIVFASFYSHAAEKINSDILEIGTPNLKELGLGSLHNLHTENSCKETGEFDSPRVRFGDDNYYIFTGNHSKKPKYKFRIVAASDPEIERRNNRASDFGVTKMEPNDDSLSGNKFLEKINQWNSSQKIIANNTYYKNDMIKIEEAWAEKDNKIFLEKMTNAQKIFSSDRLKVFGANAKNRYLTTRALILLIEIPHFVKKSSFLVSMVSENFNSKILSALRIMHKERKETDLLYWGIILESLLSEKLTYEMLDAAFRK